ncbi:hypothetical protein F4808DRAFT_409577 [Astrocystis sublimbata]|nr:hypothetical protein F4808DRAFT_409577 [Astrocystis sublimbata]
MQFSNIFMAALSMGSAIAVPTSGIQVFETAVSAFADAEIIIQQQHTQLTHLVTETPSVENTIEIQQCLLITSQSVNGLLDPALALSTIGSISLSQSQLHSVPAFSENFLSIFVELEAIGKIVTGLNKDQLARLQPELQLVLAPTVSLARPVLAYISVAAHAYTSAFQSVSHPLRNIQTLLKLAVDLEVELDLDIFVGLDIFI